MEPRLSGNDFVIASRFYLSLNKDDLVVVDHPVYLRIVKRILSISPDQKLLLTGENNQSISSEDIGWIDKSLVIGKVIFEIKSR